MDKTMKTKIDAINSRLSEKPREPLGFFPTPLHRLDCLSELLDVNLYMKRDDFSGRSLFGGNKIRKLEYLIGDAKQKQCEYVFTYGASQSNHAMQTVTACRRAGLKPVLYLVALVPVREEDIRANLLLDKIMGAEIHIIEKLPEETEEDAENRSFALAKEQIARLESAGHRCYDIPMGGADPIGSAAFVGGYVEMLTQMDALSLTPDYIFHGTGTGGTLAGLVAGKLASGSKADIVSINVSHKTDEYRTQVAALSNETLKVLGIDAQVTKDDLHTDLNYYAPGYEMPNEAASEAIRLLASTEGILTDPVYTGKAFAGMLDYIRSGKVPKGSTIVFWHTGGATALFAEKEILGSSLY